MLDARYLMLDIYECTRNEIQKHPVSRNQYPGSRDIANDFHHNDLNPAKHFMQLKGIYGVITSYLLDLCVVDFKTIASGQLSSAV
jgi:hypothetical protein